MRIPLNGTIHERFNIVVRKSAPIVDLAIERIVMHQVLADAATEHRIFETKQFLQRPQLEEGDGPVHRFRRWYAQFEPGASNSPQCTAEAMIPRD